jgi:hypothetical protein
MSNMSTIYDAGPRSPCAPSTHLRVRVYADDSAADQRDAGVSVAALGAGALGATATATHTATATALGATATATALGAGALGATATALGAGALGATATAAATHTATATATALGAGALGAVPWPPLRRRCCRLCYRRRFRLRGYTRLLTNTRRRRCPSCSPTLRHGRQQKAGPSVEKCANARDKCAFENCML